MTVKPDPPPQVEVGRDGSADVAASMLFQLFATQRLLAGSIESVAVQIHGDGIDAPLNIGQRNVRYELKRLARVGSSSYRSG